MPLKPLVPLVLLQTVLAGCVMSSENLADILENDAIVNLCLLAVAVLFILLSAGVSIRIPKLGRYQPPIDRAARIFLAVLGVSILSFVSFVSWIEWNKSDSPPKDLVADTGGPIDPEDLMLEPTRNLAGRVSFGEYESVFEEHYSSLMIHVAADDMGVRVSHDGSFSIDVPANAQMPVKITWSGDFDRNYFLWPMSASLGEDSADVFSVEKIENIYGRQKNAAIDAVGNCEFQKADDALNKLLTAQKQFLESSWAYDVHRDLANEAAKPRDCARDDWQNAWQFERNLRRDAIRHATKLGVEYGIPAMNMWAGYSRRVYLQDRQDWPDLTLRDAFGREEFRRYEEYREFLQADIQLIMEALAEDPVSELVSDAINSPAIAGCLNDGQREALYSFESESSDPEDVNLNRITNVISGLHPLVLPEWRLGTWVDFPSRNQKGEIEIFRTEAEEVLGGFKYRLEIAHDPPNGKRVPQELAFTPTDDAPCRFEVIEGREAYVVLIHDSVLKAEESKIPYPAKN